jgi:epoxyqueuosine reductase
MAYLQTHAEQKERPELLVPRARSALVIAQAYFPHPYPEGAALAGSRTALYSKGEDYHFRFKEDLEKVAAALRMDYPSEEFLCFTDSAPILERDLAYRAGLGWVGKNTCLIHPKKGSLFFLGQILTSLAAGEEAPAPPVADACGSCDRCLRACPTGALESPRWLNAGKCISYWTIEAREPAPESLRPKLQDWLFGCDICQTVCPWNEKSFGKETMQALTAPKMDRELLLADLRWILESSGRELGRKLARSPLLRARPAGLKRNALIVIGNQKLEEMREHVEAAARIPALKKVADWTLLQLG